MKLHYALLRTRDFSRAVSAVDVPATASVADLLKAIRAGTTTRPSKNTTTLQLYLARGTATTPTSTQEWLQRAKLPLLNVSLVQQHCIRLDDPTQRLACDELFGTDFNLVGESDAAIHVIAVSSQDISSDTEDDDDDDSDRPRKRARTNYRGPCSITQPGILLGECCVPLDTIDAFRAIRVALTLHHHKPMLLLCGSLFSGKTTIAKGIRRWIHAAIDDQERRQIPDLQGAPFDDDVALWKELGQRIHRDRTCTDKASFVRVSAARASLWFLVLDNFHLLLEKPLFASQFLDALRELRELPHFGGFLGIGDPTLESLVRDSDGLFHVDAVVKSKRFTDEQMHGLVKEVDAFTDSLERGLMVYSGGSPGILGSLITFTESENQCSLEYDAWKRWLETKAFAEYVEDNRKMFRPLRDEWFELTRRKWSDLVGALKKRKAASDPVPLYLRPGSGHQNEAETRLQALAATTITDGNEDRKNRPPIDGYTQMCRRIRGWYLRIIVECRRQAKEDDAAGYNCIFHKVDDEAIATAKHERITPRAVVTL